MSKSSEDKKKSLSKLEGFLSQKSNEDQIKKKRQKIIQRLNADRSQIKLVGCSQIIRVDISPHHPRVSAPLRVNEEIAKQQAGKTQSKKVSKLAIMQIAKCKRISKLSGSCEVKYHVLAAIKKDDTRFDKSRQSQVRYSLQLKRRDKND